MNANPLKSWLGAHLGIVYVFLYGPILVLVALSFNKAGMPTVWSGFSLEWYGKLFEHQKIIASVGNSLFIAAIATLLSTIIGTFG